MSPPHSVRELPPHPREVRLKRLALGLWVGYAALIVVGTLLLGPERQSVVGHYRRAALAWIDGAPLYSGGEHGFLYLPIFAVIYAPFAALPFALGSALWRIVNLAILGAGLWSMARGSAGSRDARTFLVASACALPLAYASARHGQSTLAMAGAMLGASAALADGHWRKAAAWAGVGLALKPLIVVFLLLAVVAHRRLLLPLLWAVAAALALPWLAQSPAYVLRQNLDCLHMFRLAGDPTEILRYPDLLCALRSLSVWVSPSVAFAVRALAALCTLGLYLFLRTRLPARRAALWLLTLSSAYLLLFNPRTEHNTYSLLGPCLGLFAAWAWGGGRAGAASDGLTQPPGPPEPLELVAGDAERLRWAAGHALLAFWIWQDRDLLRFLTGPFAPWTKPLATLLFLALAGAQTVRWTRQPGRRATTTRSA